MLALGVAYLQSNIPNFGWAGSLLAVDWEKVMSSTRTREWRKLCLKALRETEPERQKAIVLELNRFVDKDVYTFGSLRVDVGRAEVTRNSKIVDLTALEFKLLQYFIERAGVPLSRESLLRAVWGYPNGALTRTVDVHVAYLRQKLEHDPKRPRLIVTVPGVGYKFPGLQTRSHSNESTLDGQLGALDT